MKISEVYEFGSMPLQVAEKLVEQLVGQSVVDLAALMAGMSEESQVEYWDKNLAALLEQLKVEKLADELVGSKELHLAVWKENLKVEMLE